MFFKIKLSRSALELKVEIYDKLKSIESVDLLKKIVLLLNSDDENKIYQLTKQELNLVKEGEEDTTFGRVISQEQLDKKDLEFLNLKGF